MISTLRGNMSRVEPEDITEDMIGDWLDEMDEIEEHYLEETQEVYVGLQEMRELGLELEE
jgi:hypothetical protein